MKWLITAANCQGRWYSILVVPTVCAHISLKRGWGEEKQFSVQLMCFLKYPKCKTACFVKLSPRQKSDFYCILGFFCVCFSCWVLQVKRRSLGKEWGKKYAVLLCAFFSPLFLSERWPLSFHDLSAPLGKLMGGKKPGI